MKRLTLLFGIIVLLITSCNNNDDEKIIDEPISSARTTIGYSGDVDAVSVLIFGNNNYNYLRTISSGWVDGKVSTNLELGKYKFLFCKVPGVATEFSATTFDASSQLEDVRISAKSDTDPLREEYLLPVEEIWMPIDEDMANHEYTIKGNDLIKNTLKRAVSQIEVYLIQGEENAEGEFVPVPFESGSIMDKVAGISLDINGVGAYVDYRGSHGTGRTFYSTQNHTSIIEGGFAFFEGPFVFPTANADALATIDIAVALKDAGLDDLATTVTGKLERNKKLKITLRMSPVSQPIIRLIDITVETRDIEDSEDGDTGIWE